MPGHLRHTGLHRQQPSPQRPQAPHAKFRHKTGLKVHISGQTADLEWRLTYIGNAESEEYDQVLDSVLVGPVVPGQYRFVFQVWCFSESFAYINPTAAAVLCSTCT